MYTLYNMCIYICMKAEYWNTEAQTQIHLYVFSIYIHTHRGPIKVVISYCVSQKTRTTCVYYLWANIHRDPERGFGNPLRDTLYILMHPVRWWWTSRRLFCLDKLYIYYPRFFFIIHPTLIYTPNTVKIK